MIGRVLWRSSLITATGRSPPAVAIVMLLPLIVPIMVPQTSAKQMGTWMNDLLDSPFAVRILIVLLRLLPLFYAPILCW